MEKNQKELGMKVGPLFVNSFNTRLINGPNDNFIGITKTLREKLGALKG